MGSYREQKPPRDLRQIAWAKEGEWIRSLGVPIGNDLDHAQFWKKKDQATRDKANRWAGLCRSSYFGRNLIVQAMYFGRLRYCFFSVFMDKNMMSCEALLRKTRLPLHIVHVYRHGAEVDRALLSVQLTAVWTAMDQIRAASSIISSGDTCYVAVYM